MINSIVPACLAALSVVLFIILSISSLFMQIGNNCAHAHHKSIADYEINEMEYQYCAFHYFVY